MTARPGSGLLAEIGFEEALVQALGALGVREAYGVSGGAIAALWHAMSASPWRVCHFRHESGAAFAATEASLAAGRPVVVFTTTGPGLTNVLTGITAARSEGAQVILISAVTAPGGHGRHAIQETSPFTMPAEFYTPGAIFDHAAILDTPAALAACLQEVARGLARRQGYVAHLAVPMSHRLPCTVRPERIERAAASPSTVDVERAIALLAGDSFAIWLGFGARAAAGDVARFVERSGAPVFCTPRAKGVLPETHPQFIGVTGIGGHDSVAAWVVACKPARILVLGSRLGEASSMWDARFVPRCGFVHVDVDPDVPGRVYRDVETSAIIADIGAFLRAMLARWPERRGPALPCGPPVTAALSLPHTRHVRPEILMDAVQRQVIDRGSEMVFAESGHAFIWATHRLRFATPGRFRVSTGVGAMGHAACGVVGAALATGRRAVAIVGDGAMLMSNELHAAVTYGALAVWIVLNDARYGMCHQGMQALGLQADADFPPVDFVALARAQGADGVRVTHEAELDDALCRALRATGPFVVDVLIDRNASAPTGARNRALSRLSVDDAESHSFPVRQ